MRDSVWVDAALFAQLFKMLPKMGCRLVLFAKDVVFLEAFHRPIILHHMPYPADHANTALRIEYSERPPSRQQLVQTRLYLSRTARGDGVLLHS